jgi:integrase
MGRVYLPKLKHTGEESSIWWVDYYHAGKRVRESSGFTVKKQAEELLKVREGRAASGEPVLPKAAKTTFEDVVTDLVAYYTSTGTRELGEAEGRLRHLRAHFAGWKAVGIDRAAVTAYIVARQGQGAANGSINRELGVLGRALRLAARNGKLIRVPDFGDLKPAEAAPRQGFFEDHQYEAVRRHLPEDLQTACDVMHTYGWRKAEVLSLAMAQLDLQAGTLRLLAGETKNGAGRLVYLTPELKVSLAAQVARVKGLERRLGRIIPELFVHQQAKAPGLVGTPIRDFRKAWTTACRRAGVPGATRHDFRRTAVRNLVASGVPERVAMTVTGHKTRSVFDRYHIVSSQDLQQASAKLAARN